MVLERVREFSGNVNRLLGKDKEEKKWNGGV
jgi:hypothetical protein